MNKLWLLTATQSREKDISLMVKNIYPIFEGIVAVLNLPSHDNTLQILEQNKRNGHIILRDFVPNHSHFMNETLFCGYIREGEFCLWLDSPESCTNEFISILPDLIKDFKKNNIGALYWNERPYIFRYNDYLEFFGAYHWGLSGIQGNIITLPNKEKYIINQRDKNPSISYCYNGCKSYICYPLSNEVQMMYGKYGAEIVRIQEQKRREIRKYLKDIGLNIQTLDDLVILLTAFHNKEIEIDEFLINSIEEQFRLSELFQLKVLNMDFMSVIAKNRYTWSFRNFLKTGDGWSDKNYKGVILLYSEKFGIKE